MKLPNNRRKLKHLYLCSHVKTFFKTQFWHTLFHRKYLANNRVHAILLENVNTVCILNPQINVAPGHSLNILNSSIRDRISFHNPGIITCFANMSEK